MKHFFYLTTLVAIICLFSSQRVDAIKLNNTDLKLQEHVSLVEFSSVIESTNMMPELPTPSPSDDPPGCIPPPAPTNSTPSANLSICDGKFTILSAIGLGSLSWYNSASGGILLGVGNNYTTTILTTNTTFYVQDSTCDLSATRTAITVTVNPLPNVTASASSTSICSGNGVTLASTNAANFVWMPGGFTGSSITITPAGPNTYTVTGTNALGCTKTASIFIMVNSLPMVGSSVTASTICNGSTTTINGTGATFYNWQPGSLSGSILTLSPTTTTTYTVTGVNFSTLCSNTSTRTITVNSLPSVGVSASLNTLCSGNSTELTATGANSYSWSPGSLTGSSVIISPSATTTYTVTGTNSATGCISKANVTILVNSLPNLVPSANPTAICIGGSSILSVTGGLSYLWEPGSLSGNSISVSPNSTTTYTVTGTSSNGCTKTATVSVIVNSLPLVSTNISLSSICLGGSTTITGTGANSYQWQPGLLSTVSINVSPISTTTYTVTGTNSTTGCSNTSTRTIVVNLLPVVSASTSQSTVCSGSPTTLDATGADLYTWNPGSLNGSSVVVSPLTTTTYTVTGTNSITGCSKTATIAINVNSLPSVVTSVSNPTICAGGSSTITGNGANTYTWSPGGLTTNSIIVTPTATTIYTITGTNTTTGCSKTNTRTITVNPLPLVTVSASLTTVCAGSPTTLTANGANTYTWIPGGLSGSAITVTPFSTTTYSVTGTSTLGCTKIASITIVANGLSNVNTSASATSICPGNSTTLSATGSSTYIWQPGSITGSPIIVSPMVTTVYTVTGTNTTGCTKTATRTITVLFCGSTLNLKLYIEGFYSGAGFMKPVLQNQGVINASSTMTDSILVELRNTSTPFSVASSVKTILNTNGTATCTFPITGSYYIAVKHRNGLQTWSQNPVTLSTTPFTYDFSNANLKAYGNNMNEIESGVWAFYSGDISADDNVDLVDLSILDTDISNFVFGYSTTDIDGDGNVDILDAPIVELNINNFIFSAHP